MRLEYFRIGAALRLGHRERRHDLIVEQRLQIFFLLLWRPVMRENLRVARIRRLASENYRRISSAPQNFVHQSKLDLPVSLPAQLRPEMARPQLALFDFGLKRPHERVAL